MGINSLEGILANLSELSNSDKRWLAHHLMEQVEPVTQDRDSDTMKLLDEMYAIPNDYPMSASEHIGLLRNTRMSSITRNNDICL